MTQQFDPQMAALQAALQQQQPNTAMQAPPANAAGPAWPQLPQQPQWPTGPAPAQAPQPPPQPQWPTQPQQPQWPTAPQQAPQPQWQPQQMPTQASPPPSYGAASMPDYNGVVAGRDRFPKATPGAVYEFEVLDTEEIVVEGKSRTWRATLKVLAANPEFHKAGDTVVILQSLDNEKSRKIGFGEIKKFCIAAMAAESEAQFDTLPNWQYLCAATHNKDRQLSPHFPPNPLKGKRLRCVIVPSGKLGKDGQDYGRNTYFPSV